MEALQWAIGLLVTINLAAIAFIGSRLWSHVVECKHVSNDIAYMKSDLERMKEDIGTHDTGLRGNVHQVANLYTNHEMRISILERK